MGGWVGEWVGGLVWVLYGWVGGGREGGSNELLYARGRWKIDLDS